jgi:hypothetical protein
MKITLNTVLACMFVFGLLTTACDNPLEAAINDICTQSDAENCSDDHTACSDAIDTEGDTAEEEQTACNDDLCDCLSDRNCDDWVNSDDCS